MKIQPIIPQQQNKNKQNNPQFKGTFEVGSALLRFLDTNQAWGANAVDLSSMVIPRTTVDLINRGPDAGLETGRREATGTFNHSMVGVYGTAAALAMAATLNNKFGIKAHKIFADNETFDILTNAFDKNKGSDYKNYLRNVFSKLETTVDGEVRKLPKEDVEKIAIKLNGVMVDSKTPLVIKKELSKYIQSVITHATGSQNGFKFSDANNTFPLKNGIENIYNISKALIAKEAKGISTEEFLKSMKHLNIGRSVAGLGIATAVGMSTQPINMYLTKKKTGSDGFVGVPGREKDKSSSFKLLKGLTAAAFTIGALATITTNPKGFANKLQFRGMIPTVDQLKLVYGLTIASRLLSARDKDELRESAVKDTLGFLNLLVLGTLVTKGVARAFDKTLINVGKEGSKNFFKWLTNSSLKTRDEVLYTALKGNKTVKQAIDSGKALSFKELLELAKDKPTKAKLRALNISQIAGYLYSGLVLGIGIPKLNIYMTNKSEAKRKARLAASGAETTTNDKFNNMLKPENLNFLSNRM